MMPGNQISSGPVTLVNTQRGSYALLYPANQFDEDVRSKVMQFRDRMEEQGFMPLESGMRQDGFGQPRKCEIFNR